MTNSGLFLIPTCKSNCRSLQWQFENNPKVSNRPSPCRSAMSSVLPSPPPTKLLERNLHLFQPLRLYHWGSPLLLFPRPSHKLSLMPLTSLCYVPTTPVIGKLFSMMLNTSSNPWLLLLATSYCNNRWTKYFTKRKCNEMSDPIVLMNYSELFCLLRITTCATSYKPPS